MFAFKARSEPQHRRQRNLKEESSTLKATVSVSIFTFLKVVDKCL